MQNKRIRFSSLIMLCFCFIALAALLSACGDAGTQTSTTTKPKPTPTPTMAPTPTPTPIPTKAFKGASFSFQYPTGWEVNEQKDAATQSDGATIMSQQHPNEGFSTVSIGVGDQQFPLDPLLTKRLDGAKANGTSYKEDASVPATIQMGGVNWHQRAATMIDNKNKVPVEVYVLDTQHGSNVYLMEYVVDKPTSTTNTKNDFQPILDSFKLL